MNIKIPLHCSLFVAVGSSAVLLTELAYAAERDLTKHNHELTKRDHARGALKKQAHAQGLRALLNKDEVNGVSMSMPMPTEAVAEWGPHDGWTDSDGLKILLAYLNAHGKDVPGACHPYCPTPPPTPPTCDEECKKLCDDQERVDCTCTLTVIPAPPVCDPLTIANPSFETDPNEDPNWTVVDNGAEWASTALWNPYDLSYSIDMNSGSISQELVTTEGCTYKIEFAMSNNPAATLVCRDNDPMPMIQVSATPSSSGDYTSSEAVVQVSGIPPAAVIKYEIKHFEFVATSSSTILKFDSVTSNTVCAGPILDNIQVEE